MKSDDEDYGEDWGKFLPNTLEVVKKTSTTEGVGGWDGEDISKHLMRIVAASF